MRSELLKTILIVAATSAVASPTLAAPYLTITDNGGGSRTARISVADLDLASFEGQQVLDQRVDSAIRRVCRTSGELWAVSQACRKAARVQAKPQVFAAVQRAQTRLASLSR